MKVFLLVMLILVSTSCANTVDTSFNEPLQGNYQVTEIGGESHLSDEIIFDFHAVGNRVSGNTGCNNFSANFDQEGSRLEFSTPMNTRKYCEGKMQLERQLLASLEKAAKLEQRGNQIVVLSETGEVLIKLIKTVRSE